MALGETDDGTLAEPLPDEALEFAGREAGAAGEAHIRDPPQRHQVVAEHDARGAGSATTCTSANRSRAIRWAMLSRTSDEHQGPPGASLEHGGQRRVDQFASLEHEANGVHLAPDDALEPLRRRDAGVARDHDQTEDERQPGGTGTPRRGHDARISRPGHQNTCLTRNSRA